jgi:ankyrin repeat protein
VAEWRSAFDEMLLAAAGGSDSAAAELSELAHVANGLMPRDAQRALLALIHGGHADELAKLRSLCEALGTPAGLMAIGYAARERRPELVSLMLPWIPAYALGTQIANPLGEAAEGGCVQCAQLLIDAGADPSGEAHDGRSALHRAAHAGQAGMIAFLVAKGAPLEAAGAAGARAIHAAARGEAPAASLSRLIDLGADGLAPMNDGADAAMLCAERGDEEALRELITRGAFLNRVDHKGRSALMRAARAGSLGCCRLLADLQDPEAADDLHVTAVDRARSLDGARGSNKLEALLMGPKRARGEAREIEIGIEEPQAEPAASAKGRGSRL